MKLNKITLLAAMSITTVLPIVAISVISCGKSVTNSSSSNNIKALRTWEIANDRAISVKSTIDFNQILDATIEYLYQNQNDFFNSKINSSFKVSKASKTIGNNNNYLTFELQSIKNKSEAELNALVETFFSSGNTWQDLLQFIKNKDSNITSENLNAIENVYIIYSATQDVENNTQISLQPEKLIVYTNNKSFDIPFTSEKLLSYYTLIFEWNTYQNNGVLVNRNENINSPLMLKDAILDVNNFSEFDEKNENISDIIKKINVSLIFNNKDLIFNNSFELKEENFIANVQATPSLATSSIKIKISYKNVDFVSEFDIKISDENLLIFSNLTDIYSWTNNCNYVNIDSSDILYYKNVLNKVIEYISQKVQQKYTSIPFYNNFIYKIAGSDNKFSMELNPNGNLNHVEVMQQFSKIFGWQGNIWEKTMESLGSFPNANRISNIIVDFEIIMQNDESNILAVRVEPSKIRIKFDSLDMQEISWIYSQKIKNEKSYSINFKIV